MTQPMKPFASVDETTRQETFTAWRGKPAADITTKRDEVERAMKNAFDQAGDDLDLAKVTAIGDGKTLAEKCEALIGVHSELSGLEDALKERTDLDRVAKAIRAGNRGGGVGTAGPEAVQLVRPAPRARLADLIRADFKAHGDLPALGSAAFASQMASLPLKSTLSVRDDAILATLFKTTDGWAPESVRDPGYVPSRRHPIQFVDILPRSSTTQELVRYMEETTYTNAAAGVAEGAAAPESTLALTQQETAVRKIATHIPVTREEMEDEPQVESYLNDTLPFMVRQAVDLATLKGDGTAPNMATTIGALRVELSANIAKFERDMGKAAKQLGRVQRNFERFGTRASAAGRSLSIGLTAPLVAVGALAAKSFLSFEQGMNKVAAVSGATEAEMAELTAIAKDLGATTSFSAAQAAEGLGFLAQAGFDATEAGRALPGVLQLAAAGGIQLAEAADIATNVLAGYGLEVDQLARVNDVLAKVLEQREHRRLAARPGVQVCRPGGVLGGGEF